MNGNVNLMVVSDHGLLEGVDDDDLVPNENKGTENKKISIFPFLSIGH